MCTFLLIWTPGGAIRCKYQHVNGSHCSFFVIYAINVVFNGGATPLSSSCRQHGKLRVLSIKECMWKRFAGFHMFQSTFPHLSRHDSLLSDAVRECHTYRQSCRYDKYYCQKASIFFKCQNSLIIFTWYIAVILVHLVNIKLAYRFSEQMVSAFVMFIFHMKSPVFDK